MSTTPRPSIRVYLDDVEFRALGHRAVDAGLSPTAYATRVLREHLQATTMIHRHIGIDPAVPGTDRTAVVRGSHKTGMTRASAAEYHATRYFQRLREDGIAADHAQVHDAATNPGAANEPAKDPILEAAGIEPDLVRD